MVKAASQIGQPCSNTAPSFLCYHHNMDQVWVRTIGAYHCLPPHRPWPPLLCPMRACQLPRRAGESSHCGFSEHWAWHVVNHLAHARRIIPPTRARRIHSYSSPCHPPLYPRSALWEPTTSSPSTLCHSPIQHPALLLPLPSLRDVGATVSLSAHPNKVIDHLMQLAASHTPRWARRACHFVDSPSTLVTPFPLRRWSPPILRTRRESEALIGNEEPTPLP